MHKYDYSFLESLPVPENISSLLDCLRGMQKRFAGRSGKALPEEPDLSWLPEELLAAYNASDAEPLLLVPCVTLDILCAQGPGSQDRAIGLSKLLLSRGGYSMCIYFSLEEAICTYRCFYQRALGRASEHWEQNGSAYLYYIEIFLSLLYLCAKDLRPAPAAKKRSTKRAAIEDMVLESEVPISKAEICAALPDVSPTTVEAALGAMVRAGSIRKVGAARAVRYIRA